MSTEKKQAPYAEPGQASPEGAVPNLYQSQSAGELDGPTRQGSTTGETKERDDASLENGSLNGLISDKSKGVIEMESLVARADVKVKVVIYGCLTLLSYVLSMNQFTLGVFLNYAVSESFGQHALQATIRTVTAVFQAMAQPPLAKCADYFGRTWTYLGCVFFFCLGYVIVSTSQNIVTYTVGNSIYVIGITGLFFLQNIIVGDISSTRNRWWWTQFPNILQTINGFVAGKIAASLLGQDAIGNATKPDNWRWGFGMFCILIPFLAAPIIFVMRLYSRPSAEVRAEIKAAEAIRRQTPFGQRAKVSIRQFFWQLDFIGLVLFVIGFGLFFTTMTTASSTIASWSDAHSIAQLCIGALFVALFVAWERWYAPHPLLPFALLKRKTVVGCVLIALLSPMGGRIVGGYLQTFLQVAAGQSIETATNITAYNGVAGTVTGIVFSLIARRLRSLKWFIVGGFALQCFGTGMMIRYRTSENSVAELAIVQVLRGIASGLLPYPTQSLIQAASPHEHLAAVTAGWLVVYYISGGIGSAIGGAIWTTVVPNRVDRYTAQFNNASMTYLAYSNPLRYAREYPLHSPERDAIARAQDEAQRIMVITGLCVAFAALLVSIFLLDNIRTTDEQSLPESEEIAQTDKKQRKDRRIKIGPVQVLHN